MKPHTHFIWFLILAGCISPAQHMDAITTGTLLDEMQDLNRLTIFPEQSYRMIQFSSYDRRSTSRDNKDWFSNEDGFGDEPIPGFVKILHEPDSAGTGTYLICDIHGPGALLRLWSAGISGKIRFFLDNIREPVYEGNAQDFFWNTIHSLSGRKQTSFDPKPFRQFDATYFPIPFAKSCRMEWTGNIKEIHFYQVEIRSYEPGVKVETFKPEDLTKFANKLKSWCDLLQNIHNDPSDKKFENHQLRLELPASSKKEIIKIHGPRAIGLLSIKFKVNDMENALRKCVMNIYFDNASIPQVQSPVGDFFGAAPGRNPFHSFPFYVNADSTMACRFIMPFKESARIEIENHSSEPIQFIGRIGIINYDWKTGKSMHLTARWKMSHGLTASPFSGIDIPYFVAHGKGRIVGTAAYIYNPSNAVTSWGNWWGEGDEKIFIDRDTFPSFFGTGSEDYFNYSWSSEKIFSFPYCGQPRNDGPGNRGYVSNFRWHIADDLLFHDNIAFYMELLHHGLVPGFSYGRIVYAYSLPGLLDDSYPLSMDEIKEIPYAEWMPEAYLGSKGFTFIQAESIVIKNADASILQGNLWAGRKILMWTPLSKGARIIFALVSKKETSKSYLGFTLAHLPGGGEISVLVNGISTRVDGRESISLNEPYQLMLRNHFSEPIKLKKGINQIILESKDSEPGTKTGIDFLWIKEE